MPRLEQGGLFEFIQETFAEKFLQLQDDGVDDLLNFLHCVVVLMKTAPAM